MKKLNITLTWQPTKLEVVIRPQEAQPLRQLRKRKRGQYEGKSLKRACLASHQQHQAGRAYSVTPQVVRLNSQARNPPKMDHLSLYPNPRKSCSNSMVKDFGNAALLLDLLNITLLFLEIVLILKMFS